MADAPTRTIRDEGITPNEIATRDGFLSGLSKTLAAANAYLTSLLHEAGLTNLVPSHGDILMHLFAHDTMTMQALAKAVGRDPSTITALVKKLMDGGYVSCTKDEADKRVTNVSLSSKGKKLKTTVEEISKNMRAIQMESIDDKDFETTCRTLDRIRQNFLDALDAGKTKATATNGNSALSSNPRKA